MHRKKLSKAQVFERVERLFKEADQKFPDNKELSNRYVILARKLAMKHRVTMPPKFKRMYCKHCKKFIVPGVNARVRTTGKTITYHCLECKGFMRINYGKVFKTTKQVKLHENQKNICKRST